MSLIVARISGVLRSSDIIARDVSTTLDMTRNQDVRSRMTKTLDVCHLRTHLGSFAVVLHLLGGEINHEEHEGHGEFRFVLSLYGTLAIWGARAASPQCSAACRAQNPVDKLPTVAGKLPTLPGETDANAA